MKNLIILMSIICISIFVFSSCENNNGVNNSTNSNGTSGSLARFILVDNYLYTVDETTLKVFVVDKSSTKLVNSIKVGFNIETIFAKENTLFLGSSTGVHIFDINNRTNPLYLSKYIHIFSCDPVVAGGNFAYSTLSTARVTCSRGTNRLDVIDISNLNNPVAVASMFMASPKGLGLVSPTKLVVCDDGIKLIDVSNASEPKFLFRLASELAYDVIPNNGNFVAVSKNALSNISIANNNLTIIGKLEY